MLVCGLSGGMTVWKNFVQDKTTGGVNYVKCDYQQFQRYDKFKDNHPDYAQTIFANDFTINRNLWVNRNHYFWDDTVINCMNQNSELQSKGK